MPPRDLSFIEIVPGIECGALSRLFRIMERQDPAALPRGGIGAIGDGDGPLRDAFTNRDINTKRSFIFFYASLSRPRPRRRPRILTRPSRQLSSSRENSRRPPTAPFPPHPQSPIPDPIRSYEFTLGFPRTIYAAEPPLAARRRILWRLRAVSIFEVPPIRATLELITFLDSIYIYIYIRAGTATYTPSPENIERDGQSGLRATAR